MLSLIAKDIFVYFKICTVKNWIGNNKNIQKSVVWRSVDYTKSLLLLVTVIGIPTIN